MSIRRFTIGTALIIGLIGGWGLSFLHIPRAAAQATTRPGDELRRNAEAQVALATQVLKHLDDLYKAGASSTADMTSRLQWNRRLAEARIAATGEQGVKVAAAEGYVAETRRLRNLTKAMADAGLESGLLKVLEMDYEVLDAERMLAELKPR